MTVKNLIDDGLSVVFSVAAGALIGCMGGLSKLAVDSGSFSNIGSAALVVLVVSKIFCDVLSDRTKDPKKINIFIGAGFLATVGTFAATEYVFGPSEIQTSQSTEMIMTDSIKTASLQNPNMPKFVIK